MTNIRKLFDKAYAAAHQRSFVRGLLGRPNGDGTYTVQSPVRPNMWYVRTSAEGRQSVTLAKSTGNIPARANLPVKMLMENGQWVLHSLDSFYYDAATADDTPNTFGVPAHTHAIGTGLEYLIEAQRLAPGLLRPAGDWDAYVGAFRYFTGGAWMAYGGATISLSSSKPTTSGKHRWALVSLNLTTNTAEIDVGTEENYATPLTIADLSSISIGTNIPLGAVKLRADATNAADLTLYFDARGWLNVGRDTLASLTDVAITTPTAGQVLMRSGGGNWVNDDLPAIPNVWEDLDDVVFTALGDGDLATYVLGDNEWVNISRNDLAGELAPAIASLMPGVLYTDGAGAGNVGSAETTIGTYTVPAAQLSAAGATLWFEACGNYAANGNSKRLRVKFGATTLFDKTTTTNSGSWLVRGRVLATGSATERSFVEYQHSVTSGSFGYTEHSDNLAGANDLDVTGEAVANNDIDLRSLVVGWTPSP
jgi:hypothetical protein